MKKLIRAIAIAIISGLLAINLNGDFTLGTQGARAQTTTNPIVAENALPGNPKSEWDVAGEGNTNLQGFATDISYDPGQTVDFKIKTTSRNYRLDIYRMGYYGGNGARKVANFTVTRSQAQSQPNCLTNSTTGLIDCGNWAVSASWQIPSTAVSGIYFAKVVPLDITGGGSHIVFIVRENPNVPDASKSDILFQTSDTTWVAYNDYGGSSLYKGGVPGTNPSRAYKVSYNRPFRTRLVDNGQDWLFNAEYPMVRWLEANGYNVSYFTGVDSDRYGDLIKKHKLFLSVGHDEYWSKQQRAKVEAARDAGVNLAFFSGNEVYWKTRWENSIDSSGTSYRTLVCYKETHAGAKIDPSPEWTGTWRDPRFSPPSDGGRPENPLTGTLFTVNDGATTAIQVPAADGKMRFWRNTNIATLSSGSATLPNGTLGYEWDEDIDNGFRAAGAFRMSTTIVNNAPVLTDYGSNFGSGTATHHLMMYKHKGSTGKNALVFGAGTVQWPWGLDANHDRSGTPTDVRMQQATVNLFADMGVQPATLRSGLVQASASSDTNAPTSTITSPSNNATVPTGTQATISGTATDTGGGVVSGVEVSVDGGTRWYPANGRASWSYNWRPTTAGTYTIKSRAIDDSGNIQTPETQITITVGARCSTTNPCSTIWDSSATPSVITDTSTAAVELGVKFRSQVNGYITGIRFYKGPQNTGTHVGTLWNSNGTQQLARATFSNETASGWQQVNFSSPVAITANTTYVASYHTNVGRYSINQDYFTSSGVDSYPLYALRNGENGGNGVYAYNANPTFPNLSFNSSNYWVDVVFTTDNTPDTTPPTVTSITPATNATGVSTTTTVRATFSEAMDASTINTTTFELRTPNATGTLTASVTYDAASNTAILTPSSPLETSTTYTAIVKGGSTDPRVKDVAGNALAANSSWSFTTAATATPVIISIWDNNATPAVVTDPDNTPVELGVKFRSSANGYIRGIRFYKSPQNTNTHVGTLWNSSGQQLAQVTFTSETASGWQQANFDNPVAITANTTYVASYHTNVGKYSVTENYFTSGVNKSPLRALSDSESGGNGVYTYNANPAFPTNSYAASNYWVDVLFSETP